ncbi:hypothetical protein BC939DRAFT_460683 [Gamsiella multidivaricata]|uniref:uncharacterized protein n=1 Tax=Gamsiella multidivaricata TaxID=101098 RepID=UPI00221F6D6C|nr:uncharacterized protein BC939DRAFT_460683 [Gamsiella multidivaricata]KAG0366232.1 recQ-mediated genome instability protein 1 [Gamsiella multidivaricata]KAI7819250.1 hypothetical protein BC939DRAFT_460683 [Gamsiella multidivaricata]
MPHDDLLVRNTIQHMGVNASVEWTRQCIAYRHKQGSSSSASNQDLAQFIFDMYLLADFRILDARPLLPHSVATPHKQCLFTDGDGGRLGRTTGGGVILQILEVQDIGSSSLKMLEACETIGIAGDQPGGFQVGKALPKGMISLDLTDGVRKLRAIVMEPIPGVAMEMKLGAKIRVRGVDVRHGVLQLDPTNAFLVGGEVASMNQHPRRLVIMNQMKKRLGLPMDTLPTAEITAAPRQQLDPRPNTPTVLTNVNNMNNVNSGSSSSTTNNAFSNLWKNPQPAVSAQDAIPSTASSSSNQSNWRAPISAGDIPNPWKSFKPIRSSESPPPLQVLPERKKKDEEVDEYMRILREQEPQWDFQQDMEMDDIELPCDDAEWEVISQLSVDEKQNQPLDAGIGKANSPPLVATRSPTRRTSFGRRNISLKSPHSQLLQLQDQEKQKASGVWEVETKQGLATERKPNGDSRKGIPEEQADGKKRKVSPEYEPVDQDFYPDRRRSRSFSTLPWVEEDIPVKVKVEKVNGILVDIKMEKADDFASYSKTDQTEEARHLSWSRSGSIMKDFTRSVSPNAVPLKVKMEKIEASRLEGASYNAAIDLSSDDDDDKISDGQPLSNPDHNVAGLDINRSIKPEPDGSGVLRSKLNELFTQESRRGQEPPSEISVPIKLEETLLEFDMDDEDDFGGLSEIIPVVPEVELDQVQGAVHEGREVKAKARVRKLGKFSLTTLAVSIPIFLLPAALSTESNLTMDNTTLEGILDQKVVEILMGFSVAEFRDLVRINEPEAKRAVAKLRTGLSEVESVECVFRGLRSGTPVIRELKILTKKQP